MPSFLGSLYLAVGAADGATYATTPKLKADGGASLPIPPLALDLTGCWEMGASNGRQPAPGCGTAALDGGDGLIYLSQSDGGSVDACLSQFCYRPGKGLLTNTSTGAGMLRLQTLTGKGNCSANNKSQQSD